MQYKTRKEEKFEEIYRTFQNDVYKISLYYTKDADAAQDISQKVFYQFYLHFENVNPDSVRAYLIRSARNLSYNWLRDGKHELRNEYIDNIPEEDLPLYSAEDEYVRKEQESETKAFVGNIMESLREENESWYEVINSIFCMEKSHEEVAEELGITKDVLYSKLYRAKKWIRKNFADEYWKM